MKIRKILGAALLIECLSACGFEPLYVEKTSGDNLWYYNNQYDADIVKEMAQIRINTSGGRMGQLIKNELIDILNPSGAPKGSEYFLKINAPTASTVQQALRDDITATREKVTYRVSYELWSNKKGKLLSASSSTILSYDLLDNPYSTTMDKKKIKKDGAKIIANDIALRIGAYFHSQKSQTDNPHEP
ncbi:MAG: hypothetical protein IJS88_05865 [Alphaproteobacteria bacterium]|nr:hypothetical protein [Alphaproteobacteria bacterium]